MLESNLTVSKFSLLRYIAYHIILSFVSKEQLIYVSFGEKQLLLFPERVLLTLIELIRQRRGQYSNILFVFNVFFLCNILLLNQVRLNFRMLGILPEGERVKIELIRSF